jgi:hypothetical protein
MADPDDLEKLTGAFTSLGPNAQPRTLLSPALRMPLESAAKEWPTRTPRPARLSTAIMALAIQGREVVAHHTFLLSSSETATFDLTLRGPGNSASLLFVTVRYEPVGEPGVTWDSDMTQERDLIRIVVKAWSNPMGTAINALQKLGDIRGRGLYFQVVHYLVGDANLIHVWLLWDGWHAV